MGKTPWIAKSEYELIQQIEMQPLVLPSELSEVTRDFLIKCLGVKERDRQSWDELFYHPIFKKYFVNKEIQFEDKYKCIMNGLRYTINAYNIDL